MISWRRVLLAALVIGVLIHVDWHLGRPPEDHHDRLSFGLSFHWLLGAAAFGVLPWLFSRREALHLILLGVLLGQGIEPVGEMLLYGSQPFADALRWRVFAEFSAAGLVAYVLNETWRARRGSSTAAPTS